MHHSNAGQPELLGSALVSSNSHVPEPCKTLGDYDLHSAATHTPFTNKSRENMAFNTVSYSAWHSLEYLPVPHTQHF